MNSNVTLLTINAGSSSLKFAVFAAVEPLRRVLSGKFDKIGLPEAELTVNDVVSGEKQQHRLSAGSHAACVGPLLELLKEKAFVIVAIGHRVVHGGLRYREPRCGFSG